MWPSIPNICGTHAAYRDVKLGPSLVVVRVHNFDESPEYINGILLVVNQQLRPGHLKKNKAIANTMWLYTSVSQNLDSRRVLARTLSTQGAGIRYKYHTRISIPDLALF